jgi:hypothetical protein
MSSVGAIQKGRSPRYPRISLDKAIGYVQKLYEGAHRTQLDADTAVRVMGFGNPSGASAIALGAVRQFGLVDGLRNNVQVSDLAMQILEPSSMSERSAAFQQAAKSPEVYKRVLEKFSGILPNSDDAVRSYLIRELSFSKAGADDCITAMRETLRSITNNVSEDESVDAFLPDDIPHELEIPASTKGSNLLKQAQGAVSSEVIRIPLSRDCVVEMRFDGTITQASLVRLVQHIDLMKDVWAED